MQKHRAAAGVGRSFTSLTDAGVLPIARRAASVGQRLVWSRELTRKLWHMVPGGFALFVPLIPHRDPISPTMGAIVMTTTAVSIFVFLLQTRRLSRPGERDFAAPVLGYALPVAISVLLFPARMEIGLTVLAILAFGDGMAAVIGNTVRSSSLPWNRGKSIAGSLAFVAAAAPAATWVWWAESKPEVSVATALLLGATATVAAAIAESVRSAVNDNLRVGITAAATLWAVDGLVGLG